VLQQLRREHTLRHLYAKVVFEASAGLLVEWLIAKVGADALLLGASVAARSGVDNERTGGSWSWRPMWFRILTGTRV